MSIHIITPAQEQDHLREHEELNPMCPVCTRFGAAPAGAGSAGRIVAVNSN